AWTTGLAGDGGYCAADPTDLNFFYGENPRLAISRSTNAGQSFSSIPKVADATCTPPPGGTCTPPANFIAPFILDPHNPNTMLAGGISLWRSTNVKATASNIAWANINTNMPTNTPISAIVVSPSNSDFILVGRNNGNIYRTFGGTGGSPTWTQINTPVANRMVTRLVIDDTRGPNWIYATFGGFSGDNIYRSTDLGTTWTDITGIGTTGLPNVPVRGLTYHPRNSNFLYVGTEVGIFTSEDAGATWEVPQNGP